MATLDDDDWSKLESLAGRIQHDQTVKVVHTTLSALGMDVENPRDTQQDLAFLRNKRVDSQDTGKTMKDAALQFGTTGVLAGIAGWLAAHFGKM